MADTVTVEVQAESRVLYNDKPGALVPFRNVTNYTATGPDGVKFQNRSKATIVQVIRDHYRRRGIVAIVEVRTNATEKGA